MTKLAEAITRANATPHHNFTIAVASETGARDYSWSCPADCPHVSTNTCPLRAALAQADVHTLAGHLPAGDYLAAFDLWDPELLYLDGSPTAGDAGPRVPSSCRWCGLDRRGHGRQYTTRAGWHAWQQPGVQQMKARMLARRSHLRPTNDYGL
ncbi:hypothetical protein [Streptomyces diastaticus]